MRDAPKFAALLIVAVLGVATALVACPRRPALNEHRIYVDQSEHDPCAYCRELAAECVGAGCERLVNESDCGACLTGD